METFTLFLLLFTVLVGAFITKTFFVIFKLLHKDAMRRGLGTNHVNIVERAYRGRDYRASIRYSMLDDIQLYYPHGPYDGAPVICVDDNHKKHMIKQLVNGLSEKIYEDGAVEIIDHNRNNTLPPWEREIDLRLKVYVPE